MLYLLPFLAFILLWYVVGLRVTVWRVFGVEEIVVDRGINESDSRFDFAFFVVAIVTRRK